MRRFQGWGRGLAAAIVLLGGGCAPTIGAAELRDRVAGMEGEIHWKRFENAAAFVARSSRKGWLDRVEREAKDLEVAESSVESVDLEPGGKIARVRVARRVVRLPSNVVRTEREECVWRVEGGDWVLESERDLPR